MEAALDYAGALIRPLTFMSSQTKRVLLTPLMHPARPFRVSNHDRSSRRGVMASSLQELISKTLDALLITTGLVTLVLEEDGTVVDTEEFFQTGSQHVPTCSPTKRSGIARVTFDLYKLKPKDFIGCLNVKATIYEMYSVSYDIRCTGLKALLRSLLRFLSYSAQVTGQFLIYVGTSLLRVLDDTEERPSLRSHARVQLTCG
uniref:Cell death inducing DFFA like effector a n=1 Tax=Aotus nancymaae TaxID=37293 RepID=A0A2K5D147_AOTNA